MSARRLAVAITSHGFGHATRTLLVLSEIARRRPDVQFTVSTTVPRRFFERELGPRLVYRERAYEPGTAQKNCFEVSLERTLEDYEDYWRERPRLLEEETRFLREGGFAGLLSDVPALSLRAAREAGIPSVALWNFTWDWILEPILDPHPSSDRGEPSMAFDVPEHLRRLPQVLRSDYECAELHLKLPFSPRETTLPRVEALPLVGRLSEVPREFTRRRLGLDPGDVRPLVLVAMGGWSSRDWRPIEVKDCDGFSFLVVGDVPLAGIVAQTTLAADLGELCRFTDLVAAADCVLTKPGYGIASECVRNRTPLLGVERRGFREAPELRRDLERMGPFEEISLAEFFAGHWRPALEATLRASRPWAPLAPDGAGMAAERISDILGL